MKKAFLLCLLLWATPAWSQTTPEARSADLVVRMKGAAYTVTPADEVILKNNIRYDLSEAGWQALTGSDWTAKKAGYWTRYVKEFAKRMNWVDLTAMESSNNMGGAASSAEQLKDKVVVHLKDDGVKWTPEKADLFLRMADTVFEHIGDYGRFVPKSGVYRVNFTYTPKVKDIVSKANKDGTQFDVTAPSEVEPSEWDTKIKKGMLSGGHY